MVKSRNNPCLSPINKLSLRMSGQHWSYSWLRIDALYPVTCHCSRNAAHLLVSSYRFLDILIRQQIYIVACKVVWFFFKCM